MSDDQQTINQDNSNLQPKTESNFNNSNISTSTANIQTSDNTSVVQIEVPRSALNDTNQPTQDGSDKPVVDEVSQAVKTAQDGSDKPVVDKANQAEQNKLTEQLAKINKLAKEKAVQEKANSMGMNYIDIAVTPINPDLLKILTPEVAKTNLILPFYRLGKKLRVTVAHPTHPGTRDVINQLKQQGYLINVNLSSDDGILQALKLYETDQYIVKKEIDTHINEAKNKAFEKELEELSGLGNKLSNVNSEEAVYLINVGALKSGSSDIHIETEEHFVRVRFRIDGLLHEVFRIKKDTWVNIGNQLKYQAKMKLNVNDIPQDGRYSFMVNNRKIDVRVSVLPTEFGESFVMRLLDSSKHLVTFEELGYSGLYLDKIEKLSQLTHGMILMTGPTGSGKTTSLYTLLSKFNKPTSKIITLEDPIEYHLEGISQSPINERGGYDFASGLRSILRQDPDVVMIGEIRDLETAETSAQAALTGHVLLSTLHTNSAIETIPRLINIGLAQFMIAPALHTIIAQRLARKICDNCKEEFPIAKAELEEITRVVDRIKQIRPNENIVIPTTLPRAKGCEICSNTGYKGRVALIEMLEIDFEIRELILNKASTSKMIEAARRDGMITMREDGILKVIQGITNLEEVSRVTAVN